MQVTHGALSQDTLLAGARGVLIADRLFPDALGGLESAVLSRICKGLNLLGQSAYGILYVIRNLTFRQIPDLNPVEGDPIHKRLSLFQVVSKLLFRQFRPAVARLRFVVVVIYVDNLDHSPFTDRRALMPGGVNYYSECLSAICRFSAAADAYCLPHCGQANCSLGV